MKNQHSPQRKVTNKEVDDFMQEYREGKHPLSTEFESALKQMEPKLFAEIRDIINRGKPQPQPSKGPPLEQQYIEGFKQGWLEAWTPISQGGKRGEPHDICTDGKNCMFVGASQETVKAICDAHNAELAAEREKSAKYLRDFTHYFDESEKLHLQLLAERQRAEKAEAAHKLASELYAKTWPKLNDAEAYIRTYDARFKELHQQLLSALAAIEKHNKDCWPDYDRINVDLSALHKHDAELANE